MRLSRYFLPVLKENPAEAQIVSHRYMLRAGMIKQQAAGIYSWLPLGFRVLRRIEEIVHQEQIRAGHIPLLMPTLQPADLWRESGRYDDYGQEMLRIKDRQEREMLYGPTNEEMITDIFRSHVNSYKDLPLTLYHIQWKFRDEMRPRFGVMRGREFLMKDGYNFDVDRDSALHAYNRHMVSYLRTYERMGLTAIPMRAASGPIGGDNTHEFLVLAQTGESEVFYDDRVTQLKLGQRDIDYDNRAQVADVCKEFTTLYARTARSVGGSRSGRSSTSAPSTPLPWGLKLPPPRAPRSRSRWDRTGSASAACLARSSRRRTTTRGSSGRRGSRPSQLGS
jgi:prolyl-tRNA synthetase